MVTGQVMAMCKIEIQLVSGLAMLEFGLWLGLVSLGVDGDAAAECCAADDAEEEEAAAAAEEVSPSIAATTAITVQLY